MLFITWKALIIALIINIAIIINTDYFIQSVILLVLSFFIYKQLAVLVIRAEFDITLKILLVLQVFKQKVTVIFNNPGL